MTTGPLRRISGDELDELLSQVLEEGRSELVLLGPTISLSQSVEDWPDELRGCQAVFQLTELVDNLATRLLRLTQLTTLNLWGNQLGDAGAAALAPLTQLTTLNLRSNQLGDAGAAALAPLTQLTTLDLGNNQLGDAGAAALAPLTQLTTLDLRNNQLGDAGAAALAPLTQLTTLDLRNNQLGDAGAAALAPLTQLTTLNLRNNQLGDAGAAALAPLTQLTTLNLRSNQLGPDGAAALAPLTNLTTLDLENTDVTDLSPLQPLLSRGVRATLEPYEGGICVKDCPLVHPPPEVVSQGHDAVLNYFREIATQGVDKLYEAKVLIVGEGGAGKTSLIRRLYDPDSPLPTEDESTKGIDIHRHDIQTSNGRTFRLNVWDFGGQQIYHATHQFFLTKSSLYVLVDDTRKDHKSIHDEGFKYWLEVIEAFSDKSPVLIFQNEKGARSKQIDEAGIKGRFPNVKETYRGNLEDRNAADDIRGAIECFAQHLPHIGDEVPAKWVSIRAELENEAEQTPHISQDKYFDIYAQHLDFDRQKALHLSRYLHDLGVFLHFQDDRRLSKTVVLQNNWATEAVFKILDDEGVKGAQGRFQEAECQRIWADSEYVDMHFELLALMEKFELCYRLADTTPDTWLAPQLLSPSQPAGLADWAESGDLVRTYRYEFLPKGLISRLMVRMNRFVNDPGRAWNAGVLFARGSTKVLVEQTTRGNEIVLRARGPERKALLSVIASDLDGLNASFRGLEGKITTLVPCPCNRCAASTNPEMYDQKHLEQRRKDNKSTIECPSSYQDVSVLELLDGLKLEHLPTWAAEPADQNKVAEPLNRKDIKIFLASSAELKEDRDAFDLYLRQQNDRWRKEGLYVEIVRWENFLDAMSETRKQNDYNKAVRDCDIFVSLFKTKTGKYTEEEFDVAHAAFQEKKKPLIYTFFKKFTVTSDARKKLRADLKSLDDFQEKLDTLGHFYTEYDGIEHLKNQFMGQLQMLQQSGFEAD